MAKKHIFSVHNDFRTGFLCKFFLILGGILFIFYFIEILTHPFFLEANTIGMILAFAILSFGFGLIMYFFSWQFMKLSQIADEVEKDESLKGEVEKKEQS